MDDRSVIFLEVMAALAVIGIVAFLIYLVARFARPRAAAVAGPALAYSPHWFEFLLAAIALVLAVALLVWQFLPGAQDKLAASDWRMEGRATVFVVVMLVAAGLGLIVFLIVTFTRIARTQTLPAARLAASAVMPAPGTAEAADAGATEQAFEAPSGVRMLGLAGLALAFLLLNWIYLEPAQEFALMAYFLYPASLAVALVLLFDKATRFWSLKGAVASVREWLLCDALVFLLILSYLNLLEDGGGEKYAAQFWDFVAIVLFFFAFWLVDRRQTRYRFLIAYGYFIALPILLLIWRFIQVVALPETISWWSTIWPFFVLAIIFFVLEVISLVATRGTEHQTVPAVKDAAFIVVYAILLIVAIPAVE